MARFATEMKLPGVIYGAHEAYRDAVHSFAGLIAFHQEEMTLSDAGGIISQRSSATDSVIGRLGLLPSGASNAEFAGVFEQEETLASFARFREGRQKKA